MEFIRERVSVEDAWKAVAEKTSTTTFLVGDADHLVGIITRKTIEHAVQSGHGADLIAALAIRDFKYLHEDEPLELALERFDSNPGLVPVLSRSGNRKVEGVITIDTLLKFIQKKSA